MARAKQIPRKTGAVPVCNGRVPPQTIHCYQKSTVLLLNEVYLKRYVHELVQDINPRIRIPTHTMMCILNVAEDHIVSLFGDALICATHTNRTTINGRDLQLARRIRK